MKVLVLGSGQLARMMALAGAPLNISVIAYDVNNGTVVNPISQDNMSLSFNQALESVDMITAEFEHIPSDLLTICQQTQKLRPSVDAIKAGGDRRKEKSLLNSIQVPSAPSAVINDKSDFNQAITEIGLPLVLKTVLGGYDGKGQWRIKTEAEIEPVWQAIHSLLHENSNQAILAESFIRFDREISIIGARDAKGHIQTYPIMQNVHTNGILSLSLPFADSHLQKLAEQHFTKTAEALNYIGVLAIEFFVVNDSLLVNEIAPRVHNSGHWTQQGTITCQFENHLRAVCDLPLGSTITKSCTAMINILSTDQLPHTLLEIADLHIHWYNKIPRAGRKMGHINLCAKTIPDLKGKLQLASEILNDETLQKTINSAL